MIRHLAAPFILTAIAASTASAQRAIGIDVSYWQSSNTHPTNSAINWANVAKPIAQGGGGIQFAFVRASRGGTTGGTTSAGGNNSGTLSQRYDDPYFEDNMNDARANGILAGAYHFARPDIATNTGLDEANHFLEKAGPYMKPGFLRPVLDLEAGDARSTADLTNWALEFSDRIYAVKGIRPLVYVSISYANQVDSRINTHDLWLARYFSSTTTPAPYDPSVQNAVDPPAAGSLNTYGAWAPGGVYPTPRPWDFWQYGSTGSVPGISGNVDRNVANGDLDFVREFLVPALWSVDAAGDWSTISKWNTLTTLPSASDRVIINRSAGTFEVTLSQGTQSIRSLQLNEPLKITGGTLNVAQYANLNNTVTINDGALTAASIQHTTTLTMNGGAVTSGAITGNGIVLANGGTLWASSARLGTVNLNGGAIALTGSDTSVVTSLLDAGSGTFDIGTAKLVVNYSGSTQIQAVRGLLERAYADGAWTGEGLTSTALDPGMAIAYAEASALLSPTGGTWGGISVDGTALLITRALGGDTNLSGAVDFGDLLALAQAYGTAGTWINGDLNYDGSVDFDDLLAMSQSYGATLSLDGLLLVGDATDFASDWALAQALVPEPASLACAMPLLLLRRRR